MRRAIWQFLSVAEVCSLSVPSSCGAPASEPVVGAHAPGEPGFPQRAAGAGSSSLPIRTAVRCLAGAASSDAVGKASGAVERGLPRFRSALALLVAQVFADHHDPAMTADHLALLADLLDARLNLHVRPICCGSHGCEHRFSPVGDWGSLCGESFDSAPARTGTRPTRTDPTAPGAITCSGTRSGHATGRRARARRPRGPRGGYECSAAASSR